MLAAFSDVQPEIDEHRATNWSLLPVEDRAFVLVWAEHRSESQVARELGTTRSVVREKLRDPVLRAAIADYQDAVFDRSLVSRATLLEDAREVLQMAMGKQPYPVVIDGVPTEEAVANLSVAKGMLEFMGREFDVGNTHKLEHKGTVQLAWTDAIKESHRLEAPAEPLPPIEGELA